MAKKYAPTEDKEKTSLFMLKPHMKALKYISYADEKTQTDIINEAMGEYITKWEKKNGPVPKKD